MDAKIGWVAGEPEIMMAGKRGKFAEPSLVVERLEASRFAILPSTDRKHQVRHLKHVGLHPLEMLITAALANAVSVEENYRPGVTALKKPLLDRAALHYAKLNFEHPFNGGAVEIECGNEIWASVSRKYTTGIGAGPVD